MKNSSLIFLACSTLVLGLLYIEKRWDYRRLEASHFLQTQQVELLRDECNEYEFQLTNSPTYEQGYRDALLKRSAGNYSDGYKDARMVYDREDKYAQGYHAAIEQFGYQVPKQVEEDKKVSME